jgi:hypothetical protein
LSNTSNGEVQFNESGNLSGNSNFTYDPTTNTLTVIGSIDATNISGDSISISGSGTFSTVSDALGPLRNIPPNNKTAAYVLQDSDAGKYISITAGGVTLPAGLYSPGDTINIFNDSASNQTLTQGAGVTMYIVGTANTGNRTLAQYGLATIMCVGTNKFVITGGGLT